MIWGLIHGLALVFESTFLGRKLRTAWAPVQHVYALSVILIGWVFFRSPTPDFAFDFLRRLLGDMRGLKTLPFELTSPLPFIEPTFLLALTAGVLLSFSIGNWIQKQMDNISSDRLVARFSFQILYDLGLIFIFLIALASAVSAAFQPGIYGTF